MKIKLSLKKYLPKQERLTTTANEKMTNHSLLIKKYLHSIRKYYGAESLRDYLAA